MFFNIFFSLPLFTTVSKSFGRGRAGVGTRELSVLTLTVVDVVIVVYSNFCDYVNDCISSPACHC